MAATHAPRSSRVRLFIANQVHDSDAGCDIELQRTAMPSPLLRYKLASSNRIFQWLLTSSPEPLRFYADLEDYLKVLSLITAPASCAIVIK